MLYLFYVLKETSKVSIYSKQNLNDMFTDNSDSKDRKLHVPGVRKRRAGQRKATGLRT